MTRTILGCFLLLLVCFRPAAAQQDWTVLFNGFDFCDLLQTNRGALLVGCQRGGIFRSDDDGATFTNVFQPGCTEILISLLETSSHTLYAVTNYDVLRSDNQGLTWNYCSVFAGMTETCQALNCRALTCVVDTLYLSSTRGIWRSSDGDRWTQVSGITPDLLKAGDNGTLMAFDSPSRSILRSLDGGMNWTTVAPSISITGSFSAGPGGSWYYAVQPSYFSIDDGEHWAPIDAFAYSRGMQHIAAHRSGVILLKAEDRMYRSSDNGATWAIFPIPDQSCASALLYVDRQGRVYADWHVGRLIRFSTPLTGTDGPAPADFACSISPNPVRQRARITAQLPSSSPVYLTIVDALGRVVLRRDDTRRDQGVRTWDVDAATLPPGTYRALLRVGNICRVLPFTRLP
jgi:hypothetical protein